MLHHDDGHAAVWRDLTEELLQRIQTAGRGAKADDAGRNQPGETRGGIR